MRRPGSVHRDPQVSLAALALSFARIASSAFGGGTMAMARRELVTHRRWIGEDDFLELLSLAQVTPGPNLTNIAVLAGSRLRGPLGALVAFFAMMTPGYLILMLLAALILSGADQPWVAGALRGCAAGAVGLSLANALELTARFRRNLVGLAFIALTAAAVGRGHVSLPVALVVLLPPAWFLMRRR